MRVHYVLNHGGVPASKLADVEIHFEEGLLAGLKLVGCSVWRAKKGDGPTVLVPSRSYATAGGVRYYELLRPSVDGAASGAADTVDTPAKLAVRKFKDYVRDEYRKIAELPGERPAPAGRSGGKKSAEGAAAR
jgi:hypothetical protein